MPLDATEIPLRRPRIPLAELVGKQEESRRDTAVLHAEALLAEEFTHAGVVAFQTHEDR